MTESDVERQIERIRLRLEGLRERSERERSEPDAPLHEAVEELSRTLEELALTLEELSSTSDELAGVRHAAEEHARRYHDLFQFAPDGYVVTDERGVIRETNAMAQQQLGRPDRDLAGTPLLPLVAAPDRDAFLACLAELREGPGRSEGSLLRFGGEHGFDALVSAVLERRDGRREIRWTLRDVSELRERDAFRNEIERHLESVVWLDQLDPFRVLHASPAYEVVWGRPVASLYANPRDWLEPIHPDDRPRVEAAFERLVCGEAVDVEFRILRPDGEERWIRDRGTPFHDAHGRRALAAGIAEDVTGRKKAAIALERAERLRRAAALAAERAEARERRALAVDLHDAVSQPLALARTQVAALRDVTDEAQRLAGLRKLGSLIADADERVRTLTFRLSPPVLHDLGLAAAAEWLADDLDRRFGLKVQVTDTGLPEPLGDEVREALFRSLRELLVNVARHAGTDHAHVHVGREGDLAKVEVRDVGVGFDLGGGGRAGFGLVSIQERIEALGGRLEIESQPGRGTCARVLAPPSQGGSPP